MPDIDPWKDRLSAEAERLLATAQSFASEDRTTTVHLLMALLADRRSLLPRGLLLLGAYQPVRRALGIPESPRGAQAPFDVERASGALREFLDRTFRRAAESGRERIDEKTLVEAQLEAARNEPRHRLVGAGLSAEQIEQVRAWVEQQPDASAAESLMPLDRVRAFLRDRVINQDAAIDEVHRTICRVRTGCADPEELAGIFLFVGPSGVGKTYLAKLIAQTLYPASPEDPEARVVMIECGRYKAKHEASALFGAAPGYVGMDAGILANGIRDKGPCVIIFDEAEKMCPEIWDSLLTAFNEARIRDNYGRSYPMGNCLVVLTSNSGIRKAEEFKLSILRQDDAEADRILRESSDDGGLPAPKAQKQAVTSVEEFFRNPNCRDGYTHILLEAARKCFGAPMFSRIDEKIGFNGFSRTDYERIAGMALSDLDARIQQTHRVRIQWDASAAAAVASVVGADIHGDARAVARFVRKRVLDDAFVPLLMRKEPLRPVYAVQPKSTPRGVFERFELVPADGASP